MVLKRCLVNGIYDMDNLSVKGEHMVWISSVVKVNTGNGYDVCSKGIHGVESCVFKWNTWYVETVYK